MTHSRRFEALSQRPINRETFVEPWPEAGLMMTDSPYDPAPSLRLEDGQVVEMDGRQRDDFDALDLFIIAHALDLSVAEEAMATPAETYARMLADINVPASDIRRLVRGCTPARLVEIIRHMNVLEMMMGLAKMRIRRTPANQAHVTNWREHPALLAADAAEAALRGFAEVETTVRVARAAPFNALAILVGTQTGRGGVLTQCAVEESLGLKIAMKGLTTYAETLPLRPAYSFSGQIYEYRLTGFDAKVGTLAEHLAKLLERDVAGYPPSDPNPNRDPDGGWCRTIRRVIQEIDGAGYSERQLNRDLEAAGFAGTKWSEIISAVRKVIELRLCDDHWGDFGGGSLAAG